MMSLDPRVWRRSGVFIVLTLLLLVSACGGGPLSIEEELAEVDKQWRAGRSSAALIALKNAVAARPEEPNIRRRLAEMYLVLGNPDGAQAEIEKATKSGLDTRSVEVLNIRLAVLRNQADVALAKFETDTSIANDPALKSLHAEILGLGGRLDKSLDVYAEVLTQPQPDAAAFQGMARVLMVRGDLKRAREFLDKAIAADGVNWNNYMFDADLREREKDYTGAQKSLRKAAQLNPFVIFPALAEVRLNLTQQKFDDAKQVLAGLDKRAARDPSVAYYRAMVAYGAHDFDVAEDNFREVLSFAPNHPQAQLYLGYLLYRKGSLEQAENFLTVYRQLVPDFEPAKKLLASIQLKRAKPEEALKTLGKLDADADAHMLGLQANALFATGEAEAGLRSLQAAAQRAPEDTRLKHALALASAKLGKVDDAIAMLEPEAPFDTPLNQTDTMRLYLHMTRKDWDKVIEVGEKMRTEKGDAPELLNALASGYMGKGDLPKAVELLKLAVAVSPKSSALLSNLALVMMRSGDLAGGTKYVQQLLALDANDGANLTLAGAAADAAGETAKAIDYYEKARAANPNALVARLALSTLYARMQNHAKSAELATEALALSPGHFGATLDLGHGLRGQGKLAEAEKVARDAMTLAPDSPKSQFLLGSVLLETKRFNEAEKALSRANAGMPDSPDVAVALTLALIGKRDPHSLAVAEDMINKLVKGERQSATVSGLRGELATAKGDNKAAAAFFQAALKADDRDGWAIQRALALMRDGQTDAAVALLAARSAASPKATEAPLLLAQILQQLERGKEAVAVYQKILVADPKQLIALNNLALLESGLGLPGALDHAKAAYDLKQDDPQLADTYGWILFKSGNKEGALQVMKFAADGAPADGGIQYRYATVLVSLGSARQAADVLKKALSAGDFRERKAAGQLLSELR